jgi:tetratricopeptide (TPR) repeat protein
LKNKIGFFNISILIMGIALVVVLSQMGCNAATKEGASHSDHVIHEEDEPKRPPVRVTDAQLPAEADLDSVVNAAIVSIEEGKSSGDMGMVMNEGIMKLRAVLERNENHEEATFQLALLSLESGQLEKAEKRFEKLILLHPENQEYKSMLSDLREKLAK